MFNHFFLKVVLFMKNVEKYGGDRAAAGDNVEARRVLDKQGYTRASTRPRLCTPTNTHTHTRIRARAHTHTHTHAHTHT